MKVYIDNIIQGNDKTIYFKYNSFVIPALSLDDSFEVNEMYDVTIEIEDIINIEVIESQSFNLSYEDEIYLITLKLEQISEENLLIMEFHFNKIMIECEQLENPIMNKFYLIKFKNLFLHNNNV
jgi:hypothetical protein